MRFNVIIGNPPYQEGNQSIYQRFIDKSIKLNPTHIILITKDNWMIGKTLKSTRDGMLKFGINSITYYPIPGEIFNNIHGGITITHLNKQSKITTYKEIHNGEVITQKQSELKENGLILTSEIGNIVEKIQSNQEFEPYDLAKNARIFSIASNGYVMHSTYTEDRIKYSEKQTEEYNIAVVFMDTSHNSYRKYIRYEDIPKGKSEVYKYKVICGSKAQLNNTVLYQMQILNPGEIMTNSWGIVGLADTVEEATAIYKYSCTKFFRALTRAGISGDRVTFGIGCTCHIPLQKFDNSSDIDWTKSITKINQQLYQKYNLSKEEIDYIENLIIQ